LKNIDKKANNKQTLLKVLKYINKYWIFVLLSVVFAAVTVAFTLYVPVLIGDAIDYIVKADEVNYSAIFELLKKIVIVIGITAIAQWIMNISNNKIAYNVVRDIRNEAFKKIEILPLKYMDSHSYGETVSRVIADVDQFSDGLLMGFTQLFTGVITILGTLGFMLILNARITLVVVLITPISLFVANFIAKKTFAMFKVQSETRAEQTALIDEMIENQKVVQAFGYKQKALNKFDEINDRLGKSSLKAIFFSSITNPATRFVNGLVYTGVGIAGALSAISGMISVGQLTCFLSYANQYTKPFNEISGVITELQNALACAERILELIEEQPQLPEMDNAIVLSNVDGEVELSDVCFSYTPERKLIENFNLHVKPGQRVAIVGPTGCGKTTIINLLMRFYDVNSGSIKVSDTDIRNVTRKSLRTSYGMVLQETWLKSGTIRENIMMGKSDATEAEVIEAAKAAHIHSFIKRLPKGYDTVITEDGGSLSQGQKQLYQNGNQNSRCICKNDAGKNQLHCSASTFYNSASRYHFGYEKW
jgi:ATP-binding cassette subfamily B protein